MNLSIDQIKEILTGAVRVEEENGSVNVFRFTKEQEELYKKRSADFYTKSFSSSGIKLLFKTDSKSLNLKVETEKSSSRKYFSFDVFVDGKPIGYIDNFSGLELPADYTQIDVPRGIFNKSFHLGDGVKTVCVYFPWSVKTVIKEILLDDGAYIEGVKPEKKLIAFGDSITHGYDALRPSNKYITKIADKLGAEEFNKGIGGEIFFPELAGAKDPIEPDFITVAYGTNDWSTKDSETFKVNCKGFYTNLSKNYPNAKIFAITPIWRKDMNVEKKFGSFDRVELFIRNAVKDLDNVTVISGFEFVPQDEKYYADLRLHPNDKGFEFYTDSLYSEIKKYIKEN